MDREPSQEEIKEFLRSIGTDDLLDEGSDSEVYRQTGELIAAFFRDIQNRFLSIEYRLSRLERERDLRERTTGIFKIP